jgi:RNA polymerase sigma-70 factor (ECF subfamily)
MTEALGEAESAVVDADEVRAFVARTVPEVYRYLYRLTGGDAPLTEDLVQETCLALVREARANIAFAVDVGWMIVVARRRYLDHVRSSTREQARVLRAEQVLAAAPGPEAQLAGAAVQALASLSADHRAALVLHYVDDLPLAEVATHLGRSVSATKSLLARARADLAARLEGDIDG